MPLLIIARLLLALAGFQDLGPLIWTGKWIGDPSDATPTEKDAAQWASELRRQSEALQTLTSVNRDFAKQLAALDRMRALANWSRDFPGKAEIVAEIAEVRADWLEKLGRHAEAVFAAQHPLVMPEENYNPPYDRFVWAPSNGALAKLLAQIDALPRTVALRQRFSPGTPAAQGGDAIEDVVRNTLVNGDATTLRDFGARCVPALQKVLLERPDAETRREALDPLAVLLSIDRKAGENLILSTVGKRGPVWTLRAISALSYSGATNSSWIAAADPYSPPRFSDPLTLQVIDALAAQPMTALQFFQLLEPLVGVDMVTPAMKDFLSGQVQTTDQVLLTVLRKMLDGLRVGPNKRALHEAFLDSPDAELRERCAESLLRYPVGPATLRATQHADPMVRKLAASALVRHQATAFNYARNQAANPTDLRWYEVPRTPEITAALLRLAKDSERSVRSELVDALQGSREEPPAEVLALLLADSDPQVRQAAAFDWSFKPELQAHVLETLAGDSDAQVLRGVGLALNLRSPFGKTKLTQAEFQLYLPALVKWLGNPATNFASDPNYGPKLPLESALQTSEGARLVFDVCVRGSNKEALVPALLEAVSWRRDRPQDQSITDTLDAPRIAELFALCCKLWMENVVEGAQRMLFESVARGELDAKPFLDLARDEGQPRRTRLRALAIAAPRCGPGFQDVVFAFLRGATPEELASDQQSCRDFINLLNNMLKVWPEIDLARSELCADAKVADGLALYVAAYGYRGGPLDAAATRACLQRWSRLDEGWKRWDRNLFYRLDPGVDAGVLELWRGSYRVALLSYPVVGAMAKFPRDESVPLLTECVRGEWMSGGADNAEDVRTDAIRALTTRLDDLGADALLKAIASVGNDATRKACFDGLEQIRKYQDEKQSWQQRKGGAAAREQAIADLLPMLSDKDASIRAAAARSLGTLQAIEHLPKLVALLKDKDAAVREAAQKALDALNAAPAKKP